MHVAAPSPVPEVVGPVRLLTFLMMMAVAVGGTLAGYRLATGRDLVNLSQFGLAPQTAVSVPAPAQKVPAAPSVAPIPVPNPAPQKPTATPVPRLPQKMVVGNTEGEGVFLRKTPHLADKVRAWTDGSPMEILGRPEDSDGLQWFQVRAPDGVEGYIPSQYLVSMP